MNTRWLKQNLVVVVFLVAFVVLLGAIIWIERKAAARKTEVHDNLTTLQQELDRLTKLQVYPSKDNFESMKRDRDELQKLYQSLQESAAQSRLVVTAAVNEIDFVDRLGRSQAELRELARSRRVEIKQDFAFGFGRYRDIFPCRNPPLRTEECRRVLAALSKQLAVIDGLMKMAISNGVDNISIIKRTEVESGLSSSGDTFPGSIAEDPKARYQRVPFELQFTCREIALKSFLNALSESDLFFTIESLRIASDTAGTEPSMHGSVSSGVDAPVQPTTTTTAAPQQKRLTVTMRLGLVEFAIPKPKPTR